MTITIHIERLVLDGLPITAHQGDVVRAAVEAELTRLLTADGLSAGLLQSGAVPVVSGGAIQPATNDPGALGQQIAQAVYGGIGASR